MRIQAQIVNARMQQKILLILFQLGNSKLK